jgi:hypothetical protein
MGADAGESFGVEVEDMARRKGVKSVESGLARPPKSQLRVRRHVTVALWNLLQLVAVVSSSPGPFFVGLKLYAHVEPEIPL